MTTLPALPVLPPPSEILIEAESHFGVELRISEARTRNEGPAANAQSVAVWLMRAIHDMTYLQISDVLLKDCKVLHVSCKKVDDDQLLLTAAKSVYNTLVDRRIDRRHARRLDPLLIDEQLNRLARGSAVHGAQFIVDMAIRLRNQQAEELERLRGADVSLAKRFAGKKYKPQRVNFK